MKVGDYVRYKKFHYKEENDIRIAKIKNISDTDYNMKFMFFEHGGGEYEENIIKSSSNIKSVIEKDDFVNGERVNRVIPEDICGDELLDYQHIFVDDKEIYEEDIKSIVTKEQFESMKYEVK